MHRALAMDASNTRAYATLVLLHLDSARGHAGLELARLICVQAIKLAPGDSALYNLLGLTLHRMGNLTPALAAFRAAATLDPTAMAPRMNMGALTLVLRDYGGAARVFSEVLALAPSTKVQVQALIGLGVARRGERRFAEARAAYARAQELAPADLSAAFNIGVLLQDYTLDVSDPARAAAQLQEAGEYLKRYANGGGDKDKVADARRRLTNIAELVAVLKGQPPLKPPR